MAEGGVRCVAGHAALRLLSSVQGPFRPSLVPQSEGGVRYNNVFSNVFLIRMIWQTSLQ